jgi:ribonuclease HI
LALIKIFTDGASRGNPGPAGIGVIIYDNNGFILESYKEFIGEATNNQAEYKALLKSTELAKKLAEGGEIQIDKIEFYADSQLIVNQVTYDYQIKEPDLALLNNKFHVRMKKLGIPYTITYIEREQNKAADRLANLAIDAKNPKK